MELPNDLIKATNYSKAKEREIHEFEYVNGKYIHKYVLGGEHEMTPKEIVDCLNAIATIDCDLSTAYAYIKGQDEKIADLEAKLAESEKQRQHLKELEEENKECKHWENMFHKLSTDEDNAITKVNKSLSNPMALIDDYNKWADYTIEQIKQTKIDFAVEQLKKVKKDIDCYMAIREGDLPSNIECLLLDFADKIDKQINGLKGEK